MVAGLVNMTIVVALAVIVAVAVFSVMPTLFDNVTCPDPDTLGPHGNGTGADAGAVQWAESCADLKTQTAVVPILIAVGIIVGVLVAVFGGLLNRQ
jgi:hypothetical protein